MKLGADTRGPEVEVVELVHAADGVPITLDRDDADRSTAGEGDEQDAVFGDLVGVQHRGGQPRPPGPIPGGRVFFSGLDLRPLQPAELGQAPSPDPPGAVRVGLEVGLGWEPAPGL